MFYQPQQQQASLKPAPKNYDSSLKNFVILYEPMFKDTLPEDQIKDGKYLIRLYKHRLNGTHCIVKKLQFQSQKEWKTRFEDELSCFDNSPQHHRYYYHQLMDYFIGQEAGYFVIYIITELSRTLKGYFDYMMDKFSGFNKKLLNRPDICNGCRRKKDKIEAFEKKVAFLENKVVEFDEQVQKIKELQQKVKEQEQKIDDQSLIIDLLEGKKRKKLQANLSDNAKDKTTIKGEIIQQIKDHKRQITDMIDIDDLMIASCEEKAIKVFNVVDPLNYKCVQTIESNQDKFNCLMLYDPVTILVGLTNKEIQIYEKFKYVDSLKGNTEQVTGLYLSDIKGEFYSTAYDGKIIQWDFKKRAIKNIFAEHTNDLSNNSIIFVANSKNFISVSSDKTIKLWDCKKADKSLHSFEVDNAAFSIQNFDATYFLTGHTKQIKVWKYVNKMFKDNWFELILSENCHDDVVFDIQMIWNKGQVGQFLTGSTDTTVKIWELNIQKQEMMCLNVLVGHTETVTNVLLRGEYVFSSSVDSNIKVWK